MDTNERPEKGTTGKENRRASLRLDTFIPIWLRPLSAKDSERVRSQIVDYSVQRHVLDHGEDMDVPEEAELRLIFNKIDRLQRNMRYFLEQIRSVEKHPYRSREISLSAAGCVLKDVTPEEGIEAGAWVELHMLLPTHPMDIFLLGRVTERGAISFETLSSDQEDWIIEYLIHRQQEEIRLGRKHF